MYFVHRLAHPDFGCFMENYVNSFEHSINERSIANVTLDEFGSGVQIRRNGIRAVDLRYKRVENAHTMAALDERIHQVGAYKTSAPSHQYISFFQMIPRFQC
jgi:hypothetical protein